MEKSAAVILECVKFAPRNVLALTLAAAMSGCGGGGSSMSSPDTTIPSTPGSDQPPAPEATETPPAVTPSPGATASPGAVASPIATQTPAPVVNTSGIPKHLPTWAYDESGGQGSGVPAGVVQSYLTYAEGGVGDSKAVNDCAASNTCSSVVYFDPNFVWTNGACTSSYASNLFKSASESWFMHQSGYTDFAHRLVGYRTLKCGDLTARQTIYALNNFNSGVGAYMQSYLRSVADVWDYYLMDETSGAVLSQFYGPGGGMCQQNPAPHLCTSTEEYPTDPTVVQAHVALFSGLTHTNGVAMKLFFNGVTFKNVNPSDLGIVQGTKNMYGGMCEDCVVSFGKFRADQYASVLTAMAQLNAMPNGSFIQLNLGTAPPGSAEEIEERTITAAMTWLGYSPGHTIVFPDLETNTNRLAIWPEYNIVPTNPLESMSGSYSDLQVGTRVYRREFGACYNYGAPIGQCAAIVNGQTSASITVSASWLKQTYGHVIQLSGGDIPSGGSVVLNARSFAPASTTLAPGHAILLVR
jgi:hypothetical protein